MSREDIIKEVYQNRTDLSTFLIHLMRDQTDGTTAKQVFDTILKTPHKLIAKNPVGLFYKHPTNDKNFTDPSQKDCFNNFLKVICLTESPLDQIKHFIGKDFKRDNSTVKYSEYGFVFTREFIQKKGGNPCFYVCTQEKRGMQSAFLSLFDSLKNNWTYSSIESIPNNSPFRILPFVNIFGKDSNDEPVDYFWEREWRVPLQELQFDDQDLALALCPKDEIKPYRDNFPNITFLSPQWSLSKMIEEILH